MLAINELELCDAPWMAKAKVRARTGHPLRVIKCQFAYSIHALIDGLWMRKAHVKDGLPPAQALETVQRFVESVVPIER
jgi:hypothetical protein